MRRSRVAATVAAGSLALGTAGIGIAQAQSSPHALIAAAAPALRVGISTVMYDSPGGTVPAVVTVYNVPSTHRVTAITAVGSGGSTVACSGPAWRNTKRGTASRLCYLTLPTKAGTYTVRGTAIVFKGTTMRRVSGTGSRPVKADGRTSRTPISLADIRKIERCHNTTNDVWLTFDDSGSTAQVTSILATLKRNKVKGHFFLRGDWARKHPTLMKNIKSAGHIVGNHTDTHPALSRMSRDDVLKQLDGGTAATGTPKLLRPPFGAGAFTTKLQDDVRTKGYELCRWTTDTNDWESPSVSTMVERITTGDHRTPPISAGGNILMHAHGKNTAPGLQAIINAVRAKKLRLQPL